MTKSIAVEVRIHNLPLGPCSCTLFFLDMHDVGESGRVIQVEQRAQSIAGCLWCPHGYD